jgi:hypothetical protein
MFTEKRRQLRVDTHIPTEMVVKETMEKLHGFLADLRGEISERTQEDPRVFYGYVENISEGGIGVASLDTLLPGTRVLASIGPIETQTISPSAVLVFSKVDNFLYYYGFQFILLSQDERQIVKRLIQALRISQL